MGRAVISIPLQTVEGIEVYMNSGRKTLAEITREVREAHPGERVYLINGIFFTGDWKPTCHLKVGGKVLADDPSYRPVGLIWNRGPDLRAGTVPEHTALNYLSCCQLVVGGVPEAKLYYNADVGNRRPRSAVGLKGGALQMLCDTAGRTPEELRDHVAGLGWEYAVMLDGGSKSQCDFDGAMVESGVKVQNVLVVRVRGGKTEGPPDGGEGALGSCRVTPEIGLNIRVSPAKDAAKVGAYARGAVVDVLERRDGWARTDKGWVCAAWLEPVDGAERGPDVSVDLIPKGRKNRPALPNPDLYITVHETGNFARGADAKAHASYLKGASAEASRVSWHYTVDDHAVVQHVPDEESAYHAGDGVTGPGNKTSIGIEICVNAGGDFEKAKENAAGLVRALRVTYGIPLDHVVQHHCWNGKDCPKSIRATPGGWEAFLALCDGKAPQADPLEEAVDKLHAAGLIDSPDYWKGGVYSAENVRALIIKWAAAI